MSRYYIIPARKDSKGLPMKNRKLFEYTASIIPENQKNRVYVTTNDEEIVDRASKYRFNVVNRDKQLASDTASMKDTLLDVIDKTPMNEDDDMVVLYLTYPEREWQDVDKIYEFYQSQGASSLNCATNVKDHPYLCLYEEDNYKGSMIIKHPFYRRQDYPKCFKVSLFVAIYKVSEVSKLNDLLFNQDTIFYNIEKDIDIDEKDDLLEFRKKQALQQVNNSHSVSELQFEEQTDEA